MLTVGQLNDRLKLMKMVILGILIIALTVFLWFVSLKKAEKQTLPTYTVEEVSERSVITPEVVLQEGKG